MRVERTTHIAASPKAVYDIVMDPQRLADWVTIHHRLEGTPRTPLQKGSELTQYLKLAGRRFKVDWRVIENDPCEHVVWEGRGPLATHARVEYGFNSNNGGTDFSYVNEYDLPMGALGRVAGRAVSRVTQKEADGSLQRLKQLVE
jgi:carbon monoxide dehydrogenase subunit G